MARVFSLLFVCQRCGAEFTDDPTKDLAKCPVTGCKGYGIAKQ